MKRKLLRSVLLLTLLASTACSMLPLQPQGRVLSGAEIRGLFQGRSFTLIGIKSGNELIAYAGTDYCTMRYVNGERTKTVRWYTRGDQHCCIKDSKAVCGAIHDMGGGVYHKISDGRHSHTMKRFVEGNRL
jgi:hypothetical protein